jgi:hypothetical protein
MRVALLLICSGCDFVFKLNAAPVVDLDAPVDALGLDPACPADDRLMACYGFDRDTLDSSGNGNDLVPSMVEFVDGIDGQAAQMVAGSRLDRGGPTFDTLTVTVDAWIRPDVAETHLIVFDHHDRWALEITSTGSVQCATRGDIIVGVGVVSIGVWSHVACTYDGTDLAVHVDGIETGRKPSVDFPGTSTDFAIGGNAPASDPITPFFGAIDRARVWNFAMSRDEIQSAAGKK